MTDDFSSGGTSDLIDESVRLYWRSSHMPRRTTYPTGAPCWVDLYTSDVEVSRRFYTELLGWTAEDPNREFGGYLNFRKDGIRVAGCIGRQPGVDAPDGW